MNNEKGYEVDSHGRFVINSLEVIEDMAPLFDEAIERRKDRITTIVAGMTEDLDAVTSAANPENIIAHMVKCACQIGDKIERQVVALDGDGDPAEATVVIDGEEQVVKFQAEKSYDPAMLRGGGQ